MACNAGAPIVRLRDGTTVDDPRLDRLRQHDERNAAYPIRALIGDVPPRSYTWPLKLDTLDQGREGACVGFSIAHELAAVPRAVRSISAHYAMTTYHAAQHLDPWHGCSRGLACDIDPQPATYGGTSVLAGIKAEQVRGFYTEYRWAQSADDLAAGVSRRGPAVLGINWHPGMFDPDGNGYIHPEGPVVGGHAILCRGYNLRHRRFVLHNSWGPGWGRSGVAFVHHEDMAALLHADGEAVIPVVR